jgi:hypothetical protein
MPHTSDYKHMVSVFLIIIYIRDLYGGITEFKKVYQPRNNKYGMRRVIWLQIPTVLWLGGGTVSLSSSMYMALVMLGRQKYTQQKH